MVDRTNCTIARLAAPSVHDDRELAERGYAAGALGYVLKHRAGAELVTAVRAAVRGERYMSPTVSRPTGN